MKNLVFTACLFLFNINSFSQVDLSIDSVFHRMGVGGNYAQGLDYYFLFDEFADSSHISALITNNGTSSATNVYLEIQLHQNWYLYSDTINLCAGCTDSLFLDPIWINTFSSNKNITYRVFSDSIDSNPIDNIDSLYWLQDCSTYSCKVSRDNNILIDSVAISDNYNGTSMREIGNVYETHEDLVIRGMTVEICNTHLNLNSIIEG